MRTGLCGFSAAAHFLQEAEQDANNPILESVTFSKQPAYDQLGEVWEECRARDWDGEGASAIDQDTLRNAYVFIEALPPRCRLPEITAEPDGHLNLEWYRHPRRILSVSVSPEGALYWAALFGTEDPRGSCSFFGEIPDTVLYWIQRVCGQ